MAYIRVSFVSRPWWDVEAQTNPLVSLTTHSCSIVRHAQTINYHIYLTKKFMCAFSQLSSIQVYTLLRLMPHVEFHNSFVNFCTRIKS